MRIGTEARRWRYRIRHGYLYPSAARKRESRFCRRTECRNAGNGRAIAEVFFVGAAVGVGRGNGRGNDAERGVCRLRYRRAGCALVRLATRSGGVRPHSEAGWMVRADLERARHWFDCFSPRLRATVVDLRD